MKFTEVKMPHKQQMLANAFASLYSSAEQGKLTLDKIKKFIEQYKIDINMPIHATTKKRNDPVFLTLFELAILFAENYQTENESKEIDSIIKFLLANGANPNLENPAFTAKPQELNKKNNFTASLCFFILGRLNIPVYNRIFRLLLEFTELTIDFNLILTTNEKTQPLYQYLCTLGNYDDFLVTIKFYRERSDKIKLNFFIKDNTGEYYLEKFIVKNKEHRLLILRKIFELDSVPQDFYETILLNACKHDWIEVLELFFEQKTTDNKFTFDVANVKNQSLIEFATEKSTKTLRFLLAKALKENWDIFTKTSQGICWASLLLRLNDPHLTAALQTKHEDYNLRLTDIDHHYLFLSQLLPIINSNNDNKLAEFLSLAETKFGKDKLIKYIENNIVLNNSLVNIVFYCVQNSSAKCLKLLLDTGINVNIQYLSELSSPLLAAIVANKPDMVELLLHSKADVYVQTPHGATPLFIAAFSNNLTIVKILIAHDENTCVFPNKFGHTVLEELVLSSENIDIEILNLIFPKTPDSDKRSAIFCALDKRKDKLLDIFIKKDPNYYIAAANISANEIVTKNHPTIINTKNKTQLICVTEPDSALLNFVKKSGKKGLKLLCNYLFYFCIQHFDKKYIKLLLDDSRLDLNQPLLAFDESQVKIPENVKAEFYNKVANISLLQFAIELNNFFLVKQIIKLDKIPAQQKIQATRLVNMLSVSEPITTLIKSAFSNKEEPSGSTMEPSGNAVAQPETFTGLSFLRSIGFTDEQIKALKSSHATVSANVKFSLTPKENKAYTWFAGKINLNQVTLVSASLNLYYLPLSTSYLSAKHSSTIAQNINHKSRLRIAKAKGDEGFVPVNFANPIKLNILLDNGEQRGFNVTHKLKFLNNAERLACVSVPSDNADSRGQLIVLLHNIPPKYHDKFEAALRIYATNFSVALTEILENLQFPEQQETNTVDLPKVALKFI